MTTVSRFEAVLMASWASRKPEAISLVGFLGPKNDSKISPKTVKSRVQKLTICWIMLFLIFGPVLGPFWEPFWGQNGPRSAKVGPRRTSRASKYRKTTFAKSLILLLENHTFRVLGALKTSIRRSRRLLRGTRKASRPEKGSKN